MVEIRTRILGIAPYDGMRTAMENAAQAYPNVLLDVQTGDLDEGQAIVQNIPPNTYDCIISRGGTADLIRRVTDLPVVDIQISVYDVLRAIKLAENYTDLYAIVGFPSVTESAHTLCSLLNYDLDILTVNSAEDVKHTLERLRQGGYRMVVCDMVTHTIARQMGFDAFLITSGVESLHAAIDQAVSISSWFERLRQENLFLRNIAQNENARVIDGNRRKLVLQQFRRPLCGTAQYFTQSSAGSPAQWYSQTVLYRTGSFVQHYSTAAANEQRPAISVLLRSIPHPTPHKPHRDPDAEPGRMRVLIYEQLLQSERCHGYTGYPHSKACLCADPAVNQWRTRHRKRADCALPLSAQLHDQPPYGGHQLRVHNRQKLELPDGSLYFALEQYR